MIKKLEVAAETELERVIVSLFGVPSTRLRSEFFYRLATSLPGYTRSDVTAVYVFKSKPDVLEKDEDDDDEFENDTHVERVSLRGNGVSRSEILQGLLEEEDYYINKIAWRTREISGSGHEYDIEAMFANPRDCTGFSFILSGVYPCEDGRRATRRRSPYKHETEMISNIVESQARHLMSVLTKEFNKSADGNGDAD
ncbi:hypothetical protein ACUHMQ_05150 [Chitinimonas sp. PSY-7]|uniref:hypothetical protein n=1 Tax=Chitinimonas sp. PSY-7 TaxID=3459088 RepID=UPI0040400601